MVVVVLAALVGPPPLDKPPDPSIVEALPRPDWYFLWYFALLAVLPRGTEQLVMIFAPILFGAALVFLPFVANRGERSLTRRPWAWVVVLVVVGIVAALGIVGAQAPWSPDFAAPPLPVQVVQPGSEPVAEGAQLFHDKGCELCHSVNDYGGQRGSDLTDIGKRMTPDEMTLRILNGGPNMPSFGRNLTPDELDAIIAFLRSNASAAAASRQE